jgi:hypothetical protein
MPVGSDAAAAKWNLQEGACLSAGAGWEARPTASGGCSGQGATAGLPLEGLRCVRLYADALCAHERARSERLPRNATHTSRCHPPGVAPLH